MKLSKSTYFENINRTQSNQSIHKQKVCEQIQLIHEESEQVFGARKITKLLNKAGVVITSRTVSNYMKELKLRSIRSVKSYKLRPIKSEQVVLV